MNKEDMTKKLRCEIINLMLDIRHDENYPDEIKKKVERCIDLAKYLGETPLLNDLRNNRELIILNSKTVRDMVYNYNRLMEIWKITADDLPEVG